MPEQYVIHVDPTIYPPRPGTPEAVPVTGSVRTGHVPEGQYFAMGDTATGSSRLAVLGTVPAR